MIQIQLPKSKSTALIIIVGCVSMAHEFLVPLLLKYRPFIRDDDNNNI